MGVLSLSSTPGAVDFSYVTHFHKILTHERCAAPTKHAISEEHHQKDAAPIPSVAMETAHFSEAVGGGHVLLCSR